MDRRHIGAAFKSIAHRIDRIMNNIPAIRDNGKLTSIQVWILNFLFRNEGKDMFQRDVEREFHIRRSTATEILTAMERNDLIRRERTDYDARLKKIVPTEKAEKVREHVLMNIDRTEKIIRQGIPDEKMAVCIETLELISANLFEDEKCCTEKQKTAAAGAV